MGTIVNDSPFFTVWQLHPTFTALVCSGLLPRAAHAPADMGIIVDGSAFFTVRQLHMGVTAPRGANGYDGTWGVWLKNGADVLITSFNMSCAFTQDFGVQVGAVAQQQAWLLPLLLLA